MPASRPSRFFAGVRALMLILGFACALISQGQSAEYLLKAGFMEKFTRFIEWPGDSLQQDDQKPFIILVLGKNPFGNELDRFFSNVKIKNRKVVVLYEKTLNTSRFYHMIYIGESNSARLDKIIEYALDKPIITVSDARGNGSKGVMFNFFFENSRIRFEMNQSTVIRSGLKVSHLLLNAAKLL
jgi:hypothetical protein